MATHRIRYLKKVGLNKNESYSLDDLSKVSGVSKSILQEVYNRGVGAHSTNLSSVRLKKDFSKNPDLKKFPESARLTPENWGFSRIYSWLDRGKTYKTTDSDLARKAGY
jgi:hypothetical protein